jgi:hypothetical protein
MQIHSTWSRYGRCEFPPSPSPSVTCQWYKVHQSVRLLDKNRPSTAFVTTWFCLINSITANSAKQVVGVPPPSESD